MSKNSQKKVQNQFVLIDLHCHSDASDGYYSPVVIADFIAREIKQHPAFLSYMALNTLNYKPPVGIFGQIVADSSGEAYNTVNVKEAMLPIVNFARLYALGHQVEQTNTFDRLLRLRELGVLQDKTWRAVSQAYSHLLQLRFRHQTEMISSSEIPDNSIDPDTLTQMELGMVKHSFSQISLIQKKVSYDFQGTE